MNYIEQLIQDKCPDGVEFYPLGSIVNVLDSKRKPVT